MNLLRLYRIWKRDRITPKRKPKPMGLSAETRRKLIKLAILRATP